MNIILRQILGKMGISYMCKSVTEILAVLYTGDDKPVSSLAVYNCS